MKPFLLSLCLALATCVQGADETEFIFPSSPQQKRQIKLTDGKAMHGKLLFYVPAQIAIEKDDGATAILRPIDLDQSEMKLFAGTAHGTLAQISEHADAVIRAGENLKDRQKQIYDAIALYNVELGKRETKIADLTREVVDLKNKLERKVEANGGWQEIAILRGTGYRKTETFTVTAKQWRARWRSNKSLNVYFYRPDEKGGYVEHFSSEGATADSMGYSYKAGTYFLETGGSGAWEVVIEVKP